MKTKDEIAEYFAPLTHAELARLLRIQQAGYDHGLAGYYPDGDYSSDANWYYGIGAEIQASENAIGTDDGAVGDLYTEAHGEGLAEYRRLHTVAVWSESEPATWKDEAGIERSELQALVFISCPGMTGAELRDQHHSLAGASLELVEKDADDCYVIIPMPPPDGEDVWCSRQWRQDIADELGIPVENVKYEER